MSRPVLHVLVGPNGAGKSTLYARILRSATHLPFVNAGVMLATYPELYADAYAAGDAATEERAALIARSESFVTETVFSHVGKLDLLRDAVAAGYLVHLHVVAIVDLGAEHGPRAVHGDATGFDPLVGLAARAGARLGEVLVESHRRRVQPPERLTV